MRFKCQLEILTDVLLSLSEFLQIYKNKLLYLRESEIKK